MVCHPRTRSRVPSNFLIPGPRNFLSLRASYEPGRKGPPARTCSIGGLQTVPGTVWAPGAAARECHFSLQPPGDGRTQESCAEVRPRSGRRPSPIAPRAFASHDRHFPAAPGAAPPVVRRRREGQRRLGRWLSRSSMRCSRLLLFVVNFRLDRPWRQRRRGRPSSSQRAATFRSAGPARATRTAPG